MNDVATEFKVSNADFYNNSRCIQISTPYMYNLNNRFKINTCTFNSDPLKFKKPYNKTISQSYYTDIIFTLNSGDFSSLTIDNCQFKNARVGIYLTSLFKTLKFQNSKFQNCFQHAIYLSNSSNASAFDDIFLENIDVELPSGFVGTTNVDPSNDVMGVYSRYKNTGLRECIFSCITPLLSQTNPTIGVYFEDFWTRNFDRNFLDNSYTNLKNGIILGTHDASNTVKNSFINCSTGLYNMSGNAYLDCNTFSGNTIDYTSKPSPASAPVFLRNQGCGSLRLEAEFPTNNLDTLLLSGINELTSYFASHSNQKEAEIIRFLFGLPKEQRQSKLKDILSVIETLYEGSEKWEAMVRYIELEDNPAKVLDVSGGVTSFAYSIEDSLKLQWLANSGTTYAYGACIQLRLAYPFAPCNTDVIITKISNELFKDFYLGQNVPNPAINETIIPLFMPSNPEKAVLELRNVEAGTLVKTVPISEIGKTNIKINLDNLAAGVYFYTLVIDGKRFETKKMVVVK